MALNPSARARQLRGLAGVAKLRRTLRRIGDDASTEIRPIITEAAAAVHADMLALVPKDSGDLAALLDRAVSRDGFTARIGLLTARARRLGFYARFLEGGTKGDPARNVPAQAARPFMQPALDLNRSWLVRNIDRAIARVLARAAGGPG